MLSESEQKFIDEMRAALEKHGTLEEVARTKDMQMNTLYQRIRRCGYRVKTDRRHYLEPIHPQGVSGKGFPDTTEGLPDTKESAA